MLKQFLKEDIGGFRMDAAVVRNSIERASTLTTIPAVAREALELVGNPRTSLANISDFIARDPSLASRLLKMVNSVIYGFPQRITSVNQAVLLLGLNVVRGLLVNVTVFDLMKKTMVGLWEHSAGAAVVSRLIAKKKGLRDAEEAATYGLLHDLGKSLLLLAWPKIYARALKETHDLETSIRSSELEHFGVDHAAAGSWAAQQWNFPLRLVEVIRYHHTPQLAKNARTETAIAHLANVIVRGRGFGFGGDAGVPPVDPAAWELIGLSERDLREILEEMENLLEEVEEFSQ